jgi:Ca2+-binding RTX toxin-like protein
LGKTIKEKAAIQIDGITLNIISAPDELSGNPEEPKSDTEKNKLELIGTKSENEFQGGDEKDRLYGKGGDDFLHGGDGIDKVLGGAGDDIIHGGEGDDKVKGGPGDDIIHGGEGVNTVHGGSGSDIFHLHYNGVQIIHDFDPIQDSLQLDSSQSREDITMNKTGEILHLR